MRVCVFSYLPSKKIKKMFLKNGFVVTAYKPDIVVSYGGHGTFLSSERNYPEIPKLIVKSEKKVLPFEITENELENAIQKIKKGYYKILGFNKVETNFRKKSLYGTNEIQIRNSILTQAIRFDVKIGKKILKNVIGDGIIVASPLGATGYYKSAGGKLFKKGIGIVLNNCGNCKTKSFILKGNEKVLFKLNREKAQLGFDNSPLILSVKEGDEVEIKKSEKTTKIIQII